MRGHAIEQARLARGVRAGLLVPHRAAAAVRVAAGVTIIVLTQALICGVAALPLALIWQALLAAVPAPTARAALVAALAVPTARSRWPC
jgi:hypothetical protein